MEQENCLNRGKYELEKYGEVLEIILISLGVFLVPMMIPQLLSLIFGNNSVIASNSQYVVGTLVNTALIIAGINTKGWKKIIGIVTLPSISAMLSGFVFQTATIYTVYMIPAIWLGNFSLIYLYKYLFVQKNRNYILSSALAIATKTVIIYAGFSVLLGISVIPQMSPVAQVLGISMGINQAITATLGAIIAFAVMKTIYSRKKEDIGA